MTATLATHNTSFTIHAHHGHGVRGSFNQAFDPGSFNQAFDPGSFNQAFDPGSFNQAFDPEAFKPAFDPEAFKLAFDPLRLSSLPSKGGLKASMDKGLLESLTGSKEGLLCGAHHLHLGVCIFCTPSFL